MMHGALLIGIAATLTTQAPEVARPGYELVWSDEFDHSGPAPDPTKWAYEVGMLRNGEAQFYTRDRRENVRVEAGMLVIEARRERFERPDRPGEFVDYTSGSIETVNLAQWQYGYVEVRAKVPTGRGTWPAIWMLPPTIQQVGWPACGEIDIMEHVGYEPQFVHATVHTLAYNHPKQTQKGAAIDMNRPWEKFHIYAMEWTPEKIDFYIDHQLYFSFPNDGRADPATWPFSQPFYLKLNLAIGGGWGGQRGIDESIFPVRFDVDYVRVYQRTK